MPDDCLMCGGTGPLEPGFTQLADLAMGVAFYAQVVDSNGSVLASTHLGRQPAGPDTTLPARAAHVRHGWWGVAQGVGGHGAGLAPDEVRYWLEVFPPPGTSPTETFTLTLRFSEQSPSMDYVFMPLILRR